MSLRLILGRAGSGKTEQCMQEIAAAYAQNPQGQYILITPEQASFSSEKRLLKTLKGKGGFNVKVLSFRRFAWFVLQKTGGNQGMPLNEVGKSLILRSLLEKNKDKLKRFKQVYRQKGFLEQLAGFIDELRNYQITPEAMEACLEDMAIKETELYGKLADTQLLYGEYCRLIANNWQDAAGTLQLLAGKLSLWPQLAETVFWLDGFHGFTPAEFQVIKVLLANNCQVNITFNLPAGGDKTSLREEDVFYPPWETVDELKKMCLNEGFIMEPSFYLPEPGQVRFASNPELAWLERCMGEPHKCRAYKGKVRSIHIQGYGNIQEEVEGLANQIMQKVQEENCRYRDLVVLARQPQIYESAVRSVFEAYGIPYFFDHPRTLSYHPLHHLLRSLLNFIAGHWNHQEIFAYLKTGMAGLSMAQVDRLENYCLAHGIRRFHWESSKPWDFSQSPLDQEMEALRQKAWLPVSRLEGRLQAAENLRDMITAIFELLVELKVERQCRLFVQRAYRQGRPDEALVHEKVWANLMELFDQIVEFMGEQQIEGSSLARILESGLEAMEALIIPPALDQVTISSMDRSRTPEAKVVWILGVNEGVLPAKVQETGLLSDRERQWLSGHNLKLAPDSQKRLFSESYLIYIAFTRATKEINLSYARADQEGKGLAPSMLLNRLCRRFPAMDINDQALSAGDLLTRPKPSLQRLSAALQNRQPDPEEIGLWRYVYYWFSEREAWKWDMERLKRGLNLGPLPARISRDLSKALFGKTIHTSVTRLEKFQACPFAHFLAYGLKLKQRPEYTVSAPEVGTFFHDSLEALIAGLQKEGQTLSDLSDEALTDKVAEVVREQLNRSQNNIFLSTAWYKSLYGNLSRIIKRSALVLAEHERRGRFRPYAVEIGFGTEEPGSLPPLVLSLSDEQRVNLHGRIDRIDIAQTDDDSSIYVRIIDYKSSQKNLRLWEIFYGLKLQLTLYLAIAMEGLNLPGELKPAGMFYFQIADPVIRCNNPLLLSTEEQKEEVLKRLKLRGFVLKDKTVVKLMDEKIEKYSSIIPVNLKTSGDFGSYSSVCSEEEFKLLQKHSHETLLTAVRRMLEGEIKIHPYKASNLTACRYCEFRSVCRFDLLVPGHRYNQLSALNDEEVWEKLKQKEDE